MGRYRNFLLLIYILILLLTGLKQPAFSATDLNVTGTTTLSRTAVYNNIIVHNGGKLVINGSFQIRANTLEVQSGGVISYIGSTAEVYFNIEREIKIYGSILFNGMNGGTPGPRKSRGATGWDGGNGTPAKSLRLFSARGNISIYGQINAKGGNGGRGGKGGPSGYPFKSAGRGGKGGKAGSSGKITLEASNGRIYIASGRLVSSIAGFGGYGGPGGASTIGSDGPVGSNGSAGKAGLITLIARNLDNRGMIRSDLGDDRPGVSGQIEYTVLRVGYLSKLGIFKPTTNKITLDNISPVGLNPFNLYLNGFNLRNGLAFINDSSLELNWDSFLDQGGAAPASGISRYEVLINQQKYLSSVNRRNLSLGEGSYQVQVVGYDRAGNPKAAPVKYPGSPYRFVIDRTAPTAPLLQEFNPGDISSAEVLLNWQPSNEDNFDHYLLQVYDQSGVLAGKELVEQGLNRYNLADLTRGDQSPLQLTANQLLQYRIKAVDQAGNQSDWAEGRVITSPAVSRINAVQSGWDNLNQRYFIRAELKYLGNQAAAYQYIRYRHNGSEYREDFQSDWFTIKADQTSNGLYSFSDSNNIQAHSSYRYRVVSRNDTAPDNLKEWDTAKSSLSNELKNENTPPVVPANLTVSPADHSLVNDQPLKLSIEQFIDPDGDPLTYQFRIYNQHTGVWDEYAGVPDQASGTVSLILNSLPDDTYRWSVRAIDPHGAFGESGQYHFTLDTSLVAPSFKLFSRLDPEEEGLTVSSTRELSLKLWQIDPGTSRIDLWENDNKLTTINLAGITAPYYQELNLSASEGLKIIRLVVNDQAGNTVEISQDLIYDATAPPAPASLNCLAGPDYGELTVSWPVSTDAGISGENSGLAGYYLSYRRADGSASAEIVIGPLAQPAYTISGLGDNEGIDISLRAFDHAGNQSPILSGAGYTYAEPGRVDTANFRLDDEQHYLLELHLQSANIYQYRVKRERLLLDQQGEELVAETDYSDWQLYDPADPVYTDRTIRAHGVYDYSILTRNKHQQEKIDPVLTKFRYMVPNQSPRPPVVIGEDFSYINSGMTLATAGSSDLDGDRLSYCFSLTDPGGKVLIADHPGNDLFYQLPADLFKDYRSGEVFTWQVGVSDGHSFDQNGGVSYIYSPPIESILDQDGVAITIKTIPEELDQQGFVADLTLEIGLSDQHSGIKGIKYFWKNLNNGEESGEQSLSLTNLPHYQLTIPLERIPAGNNQLSLTATDRVGNESLIQQNYRVDKTPPRLTDLQIRGQEVQGKIYTSSPDSITASWRVSDDYTGVAYYRWAVITPEERADPAGLPANRFVKVEGNFPLTRQDFSVVARPDWLEENKEYYLAVEAFNTAGLSSGLQVSAAATTIDSQPPVIGQITLKNIVNRQGQNYLLKPEDLAVELAPFDQGSGLKEVLYALTEQQSTTTNDSAQQWYPGLSELLRSTTVVDGKEYYLNVKALDRLDQARIGYSAPMIIDRTDPVIEEFLVGNRLLINAPGDQYESRPGKPIPVSLRISDELELARISYSIGTTPGNNDFTRDLSPETDGWIELAHPDKIQQFKLTEDLAEQLYYLNIKVVNQAGRTTVASSNPLRIKSELAVAPQLYDAGIYTSQADRLSFYWDFSEAGEQFEEYQYQILTAGGIVRDWTAITATNQYTATGLNLENGQCYYLKLRACYSDGLYSAAGVSDGITVDTTPPEAIVIDDGSYTAGNSIYLSYSAVDRQSGIRDYQAKVGTSPGAGDIKDWVKLSSLQSDTIEELAFPDDPTGTYFVTLRVTNQAGQSSELSSDGFRLDLTPPPSPLVNDHTDYIRTAPLEFDWSSSEIDPESGLKGYQIALLTRRAIDSQTVWEEVGPATEASLSSGLEEGVWYYLGVKAINQAGLASIAYSDGILIDSTAPDLLIAEESQQYIARGERIELQLLSRDQQSQISHYQYCLGTFEQPEAIIPWTATVDIVERISCLIDQRFILGERYYFTVRAFNNTEIMLSGKSNGFRIVGGNPVITAVNDYGDYTSFSEQLIVSWECTQTGYAPLAYYLVEISRDGNNWQQVKEVSEKQVVIRAADLGLERFTDGVTYYVGVRGVNKAGYRTAEHERGISDGITVDSSPPTALQVNYPAAYTDQQFRIDLAASDPHSGITAYKYAVGRIPGGSEVTGGWVSVESNHSHYQRYLELVLKDQTRYFVSFQARNGTGLWSELFTESSGIMADKKGPLVEINTRKAYITADQKITLDWSAADPQSGISKYRYQIIPADQAIVDWQSAEQADQLAHPLVLTLAEDLMVEQARYQIAFSARNTLGRWSEITAFTEEITVDQTPPLITLSPGDESIVTNGQIREIGWQVNEAAEVTISLFAAGKADSPIEQEISTATNGVYRFDQTEDGRYRLEFTARDRAGNQATVSQTIRVNARPLVEILNVINDTVSTYQGRTLKLLATVSDPDGEIAECSWDFGDGSLPLSSPPVNGQTEIAYQYQLTSGDDGFTLTLTCTDNDQGVGSASIQVIVTNTLAGELLLNEEWSGNLFLTDTVIVPEGLTLTIEAGTMVKIPGNKAIIVNGNLAVSGSPGQEIIFSTDSLNRWQGIRINQGSTGVSFDHAVIEKAERGIALIRRNGSFRHVILRDNQVGVHLYQTSPLISYCQFIENELYGVKEDGDCRPELLENTFSGNRAGAYYDSVKTIVSPEELAEFKPSGNEGE